MELQPFRQYSYENGYSRQEELTFRDCDRNQEVRIATLLSKMAVFGGFDYDARGLTHEKLLEKREVFLLSRAALRIHRRPRDREVLTISTWEDGARGPNLRRVYEMADEAGKVCVSAKSDWILVDPESRKILRPAAFTAREIPLFPRLIDCPEPKKIRLPAEDGAELGTRAVVWSDLDGNGHLFSGVYGDILWDFLPEDLRERPVETVSINYRKEATLGDSLRLVGERESDTVFRCGGFGPGGPCFAAEIVFA